MANLSKIKRDNMIAFLEELKKTHSDDASIRAFNEIENHLREKKYGLVWEEHSEKVDELLVENIPILTADPTRRLCKDETLPWNFIIEGDNLQMCIRDRGQFQPNSVNFLWGQVILLVKGLHEMIVLSAICLMEPLLGEPHLIVGGPSGAVPAGDQLPAFPCGFLLLLDIAQHAAQSTSSAATIFNRGKGCH